MHLIYVKVPEKKDNFALTDSSGGTFVFRFFVQKIKRQFGEGKVKVETHLIDDPNPGESLIKIVNQRKLEFHYLVVSCDLVRGYTQAKELMGSVSDYCVRHSARTSVIIPRLFT